MKKRVLSQLHPNCFYSLDVSASSIKDVSEITEYYTNEERIAPYNGLIIGLPVVYSYANDSYFVYPTYKNNYTGINEGYNFKVTPGVQVGFFEVTTKGDETSEWFDTCEHLTLFEPDGAEVGDFEGMVELVPAGDENGNQGDEKEGNQGDEKEGSGEGDEKGSGEGDEKGSGEGDEKEGNQGDEKEGSGEGDEKGSGEGDEKEKIGLAGRVKVRKEGKKREILQYVKRSTQWFTKYLEEYLNIQDDRFHIDFRGKTMGADSMFAALAFCLDEVTTTDVRHAFMSETLSPFKEKYEAANNLLRSVNKEMREMNEKAKELHASKQDETSMEYYNYVKKGKEVKERYNLLKKYRDVYRSRVSKYSFMKGVRSVPQLHRRIVDGDTHGVEEMFFALEKKVNVRVILLDKDAYLNKDYTNVVRLSHRPKKTGLEEAPLLYVMIEMSRDGTLFDAVSYDGMLQFDDDELPDYILEQVQMYGARMGEETTAVEGPREEIENQRLMMTTEMEMKNESMSCLMVGIHAPNVLPGTWEREYIDVATMNHKLWKLHWRRILSNDYEFSFVVKEVIPPVVTNVIRNEVGGDKVREYEDKAVKDEGRFMSVTHYLLSRIYPDLTKKVGGKSVSIFALESRAFSAYTVKSALGAVSGPPMPLTHEDEYRAIRCKFMDVNLRDALLCTGDATLLEYYPNKPPRPFHVLMRVRSELRKLHIVYKK
jgi:hypothetical protein